MVEIIRNKIEYLEDLVQCPICLERPKDRIFQCEEGHHICDVCKQKLTVCPQCQKQWSKSRNRLAESLCQQLDNMKSSLIHLEAEMNELRIQNEPWTSSALDVLDKAYGRPKGLYECRIDSCSKSLAYGPLMKHVSNKHPDEFVEKQILHVQQDNNAFEHTWTFDYASFRNLNRAFRVAGMGTFFLEIHHPDYLDTMAGCVSMIHNSIVSKMFEYRLEVGCCDEHTCVTEMFEMNTCQTRISSICVHKLIIATHGMIQDMINHEKQWKCTVVIQKKPHNEEKKPTRNQRKRNNKNSSSSNQ